MEKKAKDIMTKQPVCCDPSMDLQSVAKIMCDRDCGMVPVVDSLGTMKPKGTITDRDIVCRSLGQGRNPFSMIVRDCMSATPTIMSAETDIEECHAVMQQKQLRRLLVVDDEGRLAGVISQADMARNEPSEHVGNMVKEISKPAFAGVLH